MQEQVGKEEADRGKLFPHLGVMQEQVGQEEADRGQLFPTLE